VVKVPPVYANPFVTPPVIEKPTVVPVAGAGALAAAGAPV
jgi:hypothetical protein